MTRKQEREIIYSKCNGRCAYCGTNLEKGWHVDELLPIRRNYRYDSKNGRFLHDGSSMHPERLTVENQMPSCPSCNINKHSNSLEEFRNLISNFVNSLNERSTQYKIAKRYRLVVETPRPVVFYFETLPPNKSFLFCN